MISRHISDQKVLGQNHFRHVPQTCPDAINTTFCLAQFLGVDQALGTCGGAPRWPIWEDLPQEYHLVANLGRNSSGTPLL